MKKIIQFFSILTLTSITSQASLVSIIDPAGPTAARDVPLANQGTTAGNTISLADFQTLINNTGNTLYAGVFDAEGGATSGAITTDPDYASFTAQGVGISGITRYGRSEASLGNVRVSGSRGIFTNNFETWTLNSSATRIFTHFGVVSGTTNPTTVRATFSGGGTQDLINSDGQNHFFGFVAPDGESITQIRISGGGFRALDDIAFVTTIPEPSSTAFLGLLGIALILRRRK